MKRRAALAAALLGTWVVAACTGSDVGGGGTAARSDLPSSASPTPVQGGGVVVLRSGFGTTEFRTYAVALVGNDDRQRSAVVTATFTAYDAGGGVVGTGREALPLVRAGQTIAVGADLTVPAGTRVARVDTELTSEQQQTDPHPTAVVTGRGLRAVRGPGGVGFRAEGELVSSYASNLGELVVHAICFDAAGVVTGGGFTFLPGISGGGTTPVRVDLAVAEQPASCDVFGTTRARTSPGTG